MTTPPLTSRIGVLTSGGDAQGMNAAVRAVVRAAIDRGVEVYAVYEGYQGMVEGGNRIRRMEWPSVGGIIHKGGTIIGTARSSAFRTRDGRRRAARNLLEHGIDRLVIIGGDGSLTGANLFRQEWPALLAELVAAGDLTQDVADAHPALSIAGLVGSIDNDMYGTDMTIGADTALHRITEAIDAISSTAASHQRAFVIEVMGRHCGYLALMGAISSGADWVLIPEAPPDVDDWEARMCDVLKAGRLVGRRDSIVVVAEGAQDRYGNPIDSERVRKVLEERLGEDTRITILGHVQRGGAPSAFDRWMSTVLGYAAVDHLLKSNPADEPVVIGLRENRVTREPLMDAVRKTHAVAEAIHEHRYDDAMQLRGNSFTEAFQAYRTLVRASEHTYTGTGRPLRLAIMNAGSPSPGMNPAVRAAVRLGLDRGHTMLGVYGGFQGLIAGDIRPMVWMSVNGWATTGGSGLGTNRKIPSGGDLYAIARTIETNQIDGLLIIGGLSGYKSAYKLTQERPNFPAFNIPIICLPASIDNNLPGSDLSIGADTALNSIVEAVDKIKQSAVASRRCFVVEVMGHHSGYLALMSGIATGAERVYLPEEGLTLGDLQADLQHLIEGFHGGKRLGLMIRSEHVNDIYTTQFITSLFEEEGGDLFEVRQAILGHLQQGGNPSPFDRIQATRLAARCVDFLAQHARSDAPPASFIGLKQGKVSYFQLEDLARMINPQFERPREQWWLDLRDIARTMARPAPERATG